MVDTLVYGSPNEDEWVDDSGSVATSWPKAPGETLAAEVGGTIPMRLPTLGCADEPTPGVRIHLGPHRVRGGFQQIKINEFMVDPDGLFGEMRIEWVELYNGSADPFRSRAGDEMGQEGPFGLGYIRVRCPSCHGC